jgi:hypothetical protein
MEQAHGAEGEAVMKKSAREYLEMRQQFERIQALVDKGILGRELCPEPGYWHWNIVKPDELPEEFRHFIPIGEVRW